MSDAISIPSPSTLLRSPPRNPAKPAAGAADAAANKKRGRGASPPSAAPKPASSVAEDPASLLKKSKSRNGCITCKNKRLKCDETKPTCQQCRRRGVVCGGYKKDFKWRSFEEQTFAAKPSSAKAVRQGESPKTTRAAPAAADAGISPATSDNSTPTAAPRPAENVCCPTASSCRVQEALLFFGIANGDELAISSGEQLPFELRHSGHASNVSYQYLDGVPPEAYSVDGDSRDTLSSGRAPSLSELLSSATDLGARQDVATRDLLQSPSNMPDAAFDEEDVEEIPRTFDDCNRAQRRGCYSSLEAVSPTPSFGNMSASNGCVIWRPPDFPVGSPEMIGQRFSLKTSSILSVRDGPTENPWRTLIWPLAQESSALYHALSSMAAFHSAPQVPQLRVHGIQHMQRSIQALRTDMRNVRTEAALATTIALAFAESWDVQISTGIKHVKGAKALVNRALQECRQRRVSSTDMKRLKFLCNAWIYMDVLTRLTAVDDDVSNDAEDVAVMMSGPLELETEIDPLLGCASTLFPVVGRVANLVRKVCQCETNSPLIIEQAMELKHALESWTAPPYIETPEDLMSRVDHSLQTAEAYRWATMLYLHQAVPEIPMLPSSELAQKALVALACVPVSSPTITVQFYPLLAAGCEALAAEDRQWVSRRWEGVSSRLTIGNVDRSADVVKEVWRRRDEYEATLAARSSIFASRSSSSSSNPPFADASIPGVLPEWSDPVSGESRMSLFDAMAMPPGARDSVHRRGSPAGIGGRLDPEYTVRGRMHWISVMRDWDWEVLLG